MILDIEDSILDTFRYCEKFRDLRFRSIRDSIFPRLNMTLPRLPSSTSISPTTPLEAHPLSLTRLSPRLNYSLVILVNARPHCRKLIDLVSAPRCDCRQNVSLIAQVLITGLVTNFLGVSIFLRTVTVLLVGTNVRTKGNYSDQNEG